MTLLQRQHFFPHQRMTFPLDPTQLLPATKAAWASPVFQPSAEDVYVAIGRRDAPLLSRFLSCGADPNGAWPTPEITHLLTATMNERSDQLVPVLLFHGANVHSQNHFGRTVLMWAALFGASPVTVAMLLQFGSDVNHRDETGNTALGLAGNGFEHRDAVIAALLRASGGIV